jgi:hypothetical protein
VTLEMDKLIAQARGEVLLSANISESRTPSEHR